MRRSRLLGLTFGLVLGLVIIAALSGGSPPTRADAINNLVQTIDDGPSWETAAMSAGVSGYLRWQTTDNGNDGGGGCAWANRHDASGGFLCYLQPSVASGAPMTYFRENAGASAVTPISSARYNALVQAE